MPARGEIVLARFPFTDGSGTKLRPVRVLAPVPGAHDDFLVLFISSQLRIATPGLDLVINRHHAAFLATGLKVPSVFRIGKLATISSKLIVGPLGQLDGPSYALIVSRLITLVEGKV